MMRLLPNLLAVLSALFPASMHAVTMTKLLDTNGIPAPVVYGTNDPTIQVIVPFLPKDLKPGEKRPALVLIHGGAWHAPGASIFYPMAKYFAFRGVPTFSIDYRSIQQPTNDVGVPEILSDCRSSIRYLRSHASQFGIDPNKIAVLGDSAGGHLAACLGTIPDPQDSAGVSSAANLMIPCNPIVDMGPGEGNTNSWFRSIQRGAALEKNPTPEAVVPTSEQIAVAKSVSPLAFVSVKSAPALVMHGLDDTIVTPEQSRKFAEALKAAGVPVELVLIPGARHAFILPKYTASEQQVIDAMSDVDRFLAKNGYLTGEPTLVVSPVPAWTPKPRPTPKSSPSPATH
jgi:acetyl esterase/lipase